MQVARASIQTVGAALPDRWLPTFLAAIAGIVDLTSLVSLGGIFTAHITGNLVVLAAIAVRGGHIKLGQALAVPMFMITVALIWLLVRRIGQRSEAATRIVLFVQFLLLLAVLAVSVIGRTAEHPNGIAALAAVLLAASAMAAQNALLHMQVTGSPSTAVMTGNLVSTVIFGLDSLFGPPDATAAAKVRLAGVLSLLAGFLLGCVVAAAVLLIDRDWGWALPVALAGLVAAVPWKQDP